MENTLHWGILGTGNIARQFAAGVLTSRRSKLVSVGSRTIESATAFAQNYQIPRAVGSYHDVLSDPAVEAVYVSLPNSLHHEWTIAALRAGKHVLCEKPFASNAVQALEMFAAAEQTGRVLVEAFMYRCHPLSAAVFQTVDSGIIGQAKLIRSSFCYCTSRTAGNIRFSPELAGGALMDIGCYCINFSRFIAGCDPDAVHCTGHIHETGIDDIAIGTLSYPNGILANFTCGMTLQADNTASICGTGGYIEIPVPWKPPARQAAYVVGHSTPPRMDSANSSAPPPPPRTTHHVDAGMDLYGLEADRFASTVLDGAAPFVSKAETLSNQRILDEMRRQIGIRV